MLSQPAIEEIPLTGGIEDKTVVAVAYALATQANKKVSVPYLFEAVTANEEFEVDYHGAGSIANLGSYTLYQIRLLMYPMLAASSLLKFIAVDSK